MKYLNRKILPLLLAVITVFSLCAFPMTASAYSTGYANTHTNTGNQRADVAAVARTQVGYTESSDGTKYGAWYKSYTGSSHNYTSEAWCGMFIMWCEYQANCSAGLKAMSPSCSTALSNFKSGKQGSKAYSFSSGYTPKAGDIIFCGYKGSSSVNHVGLVVSVDDTYIYTIEGNSNNQVRNVKYSLSTGKRINGSKYILWFGVPAYTNTAKEMTEVTDPSNAVSVTSYTAKTTSSLNVRATASSSAAVNTALSSGTTVTIVKEAKGSDGHLWGKLNDGTGWICLYYTNVGDYGHSAQSVTGETIIMTGTVNCGSLNVRSSAGNGSVTSTLSRGATVYIVETKTSGSTKWGRLAGGGWVSLSYIKTTGSTAAETASTTVVSTETTTTTATAATTDSSSSNNTLGIVGTVSCSSLNVRSTAGSGSVAATLSKGASVTVYETKTVSSALWGRTSQGWVAMKYITVSAYTVSGSSLNVRESAGSSAKILKTLSKGTEVKVDQVTTSGSTTWAHLSTGGWVSLSYLTVKSSSSAQTSASTESSSTVSSDTKSESSAGSSSGSGSSSAAGNGSSTVILYGTIVNATNLNVRSSAGNGSSVGLMHRGDSVEVYEVTTVSGKKWGRTSQGWISLEFVDISSQRVVVTTASMNIRSSASSSASIRNTCKQGDTFWIVEVKTVGGSTWGHIRDYGWLCLDYTTNG